MHSAAGPGIAPRLEERLGALGQVLETCRSQLSDLAVEVSGPLDKLLRRTLVALITADVHARDIVEDLKNKGVDRVDDFNWMQQLRYYWESVGADSASVSSSSPRRRRRGRESVYGSRSTQAVARTA